MNAPVVQQSQRHQVLIVGGGAGGISVASWLRRLRRDVDVAILEPSAEHWYQPGWTLVGGGVFRMERLRRDEKDCIPAGVTWIQDAAERFLPEERIVETASGRRLEYSVLVVCPGMQIDWDKIEGLREALGHDGVTSNYSKETAPYTWEVIDSFTGGTAIFTFPAAPIKCGGAPQKIMYLADDVFKRKSGVGINSRVLYCTAGAKMFAVPDYNAELEKIVERRGIEPRYGHNLVAVDAERKQAIFEVQSESGPQRTAIAYDMLHVTPPMSAPDFIKRSPLAEQKSGYGWVEVDPATLRHVRYDNIFALGDASSIPTSRTAAAVRKQAPVVAENALLALRGQPLTATYDGYTCCPLITGYDKVMMAEFDYSNRAKSSFPIDPTRERYSMWLVKRFLLPETYWERMLKARDFEADVVFKPLKRLLGQGS